MNNDTANENTIKIRKLKAREKSSKSDLAHIEKQPQRKWAMARRQAQDILKMTAPFENSK